MLAAALIAHPLLAPLAAGAKTFSQHLVLWLHIAFVVFAIGPLTLAISSTPRYIKKRDVRIVRYLSRITFIFMLAALSVLVAGLFLAQMLHVAGRPWLIISATLFVVAELLLFVIVGDQRRAIRALNEAGPPATEPESGKADPAPDGAGEAADAEAVAPDARAAANVASVERGRITLTGGLVNLIWLVILVLMVWNA
jgi:uncharacterized membrane protein